ncbi:MAG: hypothetical protein MUE40_11580 [Anaerolineae bacterium]|nr:hypothetical protein [Anaerolineae bacterium]
MIAVTPAPDTDTDQTTRFARMMRLGHVSYSQGHYRQAHRYWRRAAMLNPAEEQVWLALLNVLDQEADRQVCLQNILAINPENVRARRELQQFSGPRPAALRPLPAGPRWPRLLWRGLESLLLALLIVLGAVALRHLLALPA